MLQRGPISPGNSVMVSTSRTACFSLMVRLACGLVMVIMICHPFLGVAADQAATKPVTKIGAELPDTDEGLAGVGPIRRYDWFRNLWREKRTAWADAVAADQKAVVFLGDSITQGWGDDFQGQFPGVKLANRGISGDTTRGMLLRLDDDVLALHPRAVVLLMGTNDLEEGATPEQIAANIESIVRRLAEHDPKLPVVVCRIFPSAASMRRPTAAIQQVNELVAGFLKTQPQCLLLDTFTLFADPQGDALPALFPDLLHLNEEGYRTWARGLRPALATLGVVDTEPVSVQLKAGERLLFNGRDLTGWCTRDKSLREIQQSFKGQPVSADGRYRVIADRLVVTTPPEGRRVQELWTTEEFPGDFELTLEFRCTPNADSGVFIRGVQLQCRDYLLAGPYRELKQYRPQDWNELVITVRGMTATGRCNGELLEELKLPATGPIGLEGDRGQLEYRNLRIRPL